MVCLCRRFVGCLLILVLCSPMWAGTGLYGPYLGQTPPGLEAEIFAPGVISIPNQSEWIGNFTPDGQEFYFTISNPDWTINSVMVTSLVEGQWSTPKPASFSGQYVDWTALLSPDGQRLFFSSSRPNYSWQTFDVWMCERQGSIWSDPVKLAINSPGIDYAGNCTANGTLYFSSERDGGIALFRSVPVDGDYRSIEKLPWPINARQKEQCPWIAPDESYLIFASSRQGSRDLYISYRNEDHSWAEPVNLGPSVNTPYAEWNPTISPDGKYLLFGLSKDVSNENVDLYWVQTKAFLPDPNGPIQNLRSEQRFSSIQIAITYALTGDTLVMEPGIYHESITLDKDITLQSVDPDDPYYVGGTIVQADVNEPVVTLDSNGPSCTLAGLTLRAGLVGVLGTATDATLRDCRILDNTSHGVELTQMSRMQLDHCLITANGQNGVMLHTTIGREPRYCEPRISNCIIGHNGGDSIVGGQPIVEDSLIE